MPVFRGSVDDLQLSLSLSLPLVVLQGDGTANRPQELLLVLQAVGGAGGRTRTRPPVVRKPGHHGNRP